MITSTRLSLATAAAFASLVLAVPRAQAGTCEDLSGLRAKDLTITHAEAVQPDPVWRSPKQPGYGGEVRNPFCRVEGVIEGDIGFEVWLPAKAAWTGRLLGAGVGGNAGVFNYADMARVLPLGFASASTDSGHKASDSRWMMSARKQENYAHRAEHLMTEAAKAVVAAYYGRPQDHAYFLGCSGGGRQALKEAQLYPQDYDGIVAGAPGPDMPMLSARHLWTALYQQRNPAGALADADWDLVARAVVRDCDRLDGVADGVIEDPRACRFDPASLDCAKGQAECLSTPKVTTLMAIYSPLRDETGKVVDQGLFPGVRTRPGPPPPLLLELFGQGVHKDPDWSPAGFRIVNDVAATYRAIPELRADNPDLSGLKARGGKLIIYNGWADPSVIAQQALHYYGAVQRKMGAQQAASFTRLYMAPGVFHCGGGPGPDQFGGSGRPAPVQDPQHDILLALVAWVEKGHAPGPIIASKVQDGRVVRTRPLCPYPHVARYTGRGDTDDAVNFECRVP
jgi:feruloyl esterase